MVGEHLEPHPLEARAQLRRACHGARVQQRLVLPGPRLLALVVGERVDVGDQQPSLAARPQSHVDLVEPAGGGVHGQEVHDALREPHEEQLVVDGARAGGLLPLALRVVQEHQIEVGGVAELDSAELAVADGADVHGARGIGVAASWQAELRGDLPPAEIEGALDDELGDVREPV